MKIKRYNKKESYSYTLGTYPTLELIQFRSDLVVKVLLKSDGLESEGIAEIKALCNEKNITCEIDDKTISRLGYKENTYAVGVFNKFKSEIRADQNHVVLVNPRNMGNIGTIIRTMVGFGVEDLALIRPAADIFDPKVIRSAMGAMFNLRFQYFESFDEYLMKYKSNNSEKRELYTLMLDGAKPINEIKFKSPFSLIFGNEGAGLPAEFARIGQSVLIPHASKIDSLNLSSAAAITLWETTKAN